MAAELPHLDWPLRVLGHDYAEVEQDTTQDAGAQVAVLCSFEVGTRAEDPEFGITDPTFQQYPVDVSEIQSQCAAYVPQATVEIAQTPVAGGEAAVSVNVSMSSPDDQED